MPDIKKQKLIVPLYQSDRKSKQFDLVAPFGNCPHCGSQLSEFEDIDMTVHPWCYNCKSHFREAVPAPLV